MQPGLVRVMASMGDYVTSFNEVLGNRDLRQSAVLGIVICAVVGLVIGLVIDRLLERSAAP